MKLNQTDNNIISNLDVGDDIDFSIASNRTVFNILRKSIYSDPIGSCVREICANGLDAQRRLGKEKLPLHITLNKNYFTCRDFGVGMSPDTIQSVYSKYGASDKRESDEEQGCWGLGAKSSFAVTDTYTVETIWEGIKYVYMCYINKSGSGAIKLLSQEETDEVGTTIKIPVATSKLDEFRRNIYKYTQFWEIPPRYLGELPSPPAKPDMEGNGWRIYPKEVFQRHDSFNILLDSVPYTYSIPYGNTIPPTVVIIFSIGELEVSASRENLISSQANTDRIIERIKVYRTEYKEITQKRVERAPDYVEALILLNEYQQLDSNQHEWEWGGQKFFYYLNNDVYVKEFKLKHHSTTFKSSGNKTPYINYPAAGCFISHNKDEKLGPYDSRRIKHYMNENDLAAVYLTDQSQQFPFPISESLKNIKIPWCGGGVGRPKKNTIRTRHNKSKKRHDLINLDNNNTSYLYVFESIKDLRGIKYLPHPLVEISPEEEDKICTNQNWTRLEDYLKSVFQMMPKERLIEEGEKLQNKDQTEIYSFLRKHVNDDIKEVLGEVKIQDDLKGVAKFLFLNENKEKPFQSLTISDKLIAEYPLLRYVDRHSYVASAKKEFVDYVQMINERNKI